VALLLSTGGGQRVRQLLGNTPIHTTVIKMVTVCYIAFVSGYYKESRLHIIHKVFLYTFCLVGRPALLTDTYVTCINYALEYVILWDFI
jgi:hypothetical protein